MRYKKIRGQKRIRKAIDRWVEYNTNIELNRYLTRESPYYYIKTRVHPYCDLSMVNSKIPYPSGRTKQMILNGLLDIYDNWKTQLDTLNRPYYLKLWLYYPRFSESQVVCAIAEKIQWYSHLFYKPDKTIPIDFINYGVLNGRLNNYHWTHYLDEDYIESDWLYETEPYISKSKY